MSTDVPAVEGVDIDGIRSYLAQTEVVFAILFGSHAKGTSSPSSDVDIVLSFPEDMDGRERFRLRNRIDAELQQYAEGFVDVRDIRTLPTTVAYAALRDGILLVGDEDLVQEYHQAVEEEYEATASERDQENREFLDRLAQG